MIAVVVGTRPEAIKMAPVIRALRAAGLPVVVVGVRQHHELTSRALGEFDLHPNIWVGSAPTDGIPQFVGSTANALSDLFTCFKTKLLLVQGDTATALAGTLGAHTARVVVGHVEAGLRTKNPWDPWPEEWNRRMIDHGAQLWFAPTPKAWENLQTEGIQAEMVGQTGIDALLWMKDIVHENLGPSLVERATFGWKGDHPAILASLHRREAWGAPLERAAKALVRLSQEWPVVFLSHPSDAVRKVEKVLRESPLVNIVEPQDYRMTVQTLLQCHLVVTDSGGLQEEAPALGKYTLICREQTERTEVIDAAMGELVGFDEDVIVERARMQMSVKREPRMLFGDGHASERIARTVKEFLGL